jgi:hypothetical protein
MSFAVRLGDFTSERENISMLMAMVNLVRLVGCLFFDLLESCI